MIWAQGNDSGTKASIEEAFPGIDCAEGRQLDPAPRFRRILIIVGIGAFLVSAELLAFRSLNRSLDRFAKAMETLQRLGVALNLVSAASKASKVAQSSLVTVHFQWNWRDKQELTANQSLRNARLAEQRRNALAEAIAEQLRPMMADAGIESESELQEAALDTRIKMTDLNDDGVAEVVGQGMVGCGATGNCPFWVWRKVKQGYELLLEGQAQTFTIQKSSSNGFHDIVLSRHGSYSSGDLTLYQYKEGSYHDVACYGYEWTVLEGEKVRELKEPRITPCGQR